MKLYYTDPLAAAIMARDFGVRLRTWRLDNGVHPKRKRWFDEDGLSIACECCNNPNPPEKYYIHPGSHHIYEPQHHDKLSDGKGGFYYVWVNEAYVNQAKKLIADKDYKIIQRQGKLFYTPEVEK